MREAGEHVRGRGVAIGICAVLLWGLRPESGQAAETRDARALQLSGESRRTWACDSWASRSTYMMVHCQSSSLQTLQIYTHR